jgi:hypothetical protein
MAKKETFVVAVFGDDEIFVKAMKAARNKGMRVKDAYTPFPVHGLDHALGINRSRLGIAAFVFGCIGFTIAVLLQVYTMVIDWPMNIGGKPTMPIPSFVPVGFELTVLITALGMVGTFFVVNGMAPGAPYKLWDPRQTSHKFVAVIYEDGLSKRITEEMYTQGAEEVRTEEYAFSNPLSLFKPEEETTEVNA